MSDPPITFGSRFGFIPRVSCTKGVLCADRIVKVSYRGASRRASEDQWILQPKTYESIQRHCSAATNSPLDGFSAPRPYRKRVIASAEGRVLEIGVGSGLNIPFYGSAVRGVLGLEPSQPLIAMARKVAEGATNPVAFIEGSAKGIPLDDNTVDTVVSTWTMCTIPEVDQALSEIRRVLKRGGRLLFAEHGLALEMGVRRWQDRLTPAWKRIGGGCHLNRPIREMIANAGFHFEHLGSAYMRGPKPFAFMYEGSARPY